MSIAYADEAVHIRQVAPLTARDIACATGAGQSTVEAWLARSRAPSGAPSAKPGVARRLPGRRDRDLVAPPARRR
jgi:hypothetical protein